MGKNIYYPPGKFDQFGDDLRHLVPLEPADATAELTIALKNAFLQQVTHLPNDILDKIRDWFGLPNLDSIIDTLIKDAFARLRQSGWFDQQGVIVAEQHVQVGPSCDQYEINVSDTILMAPVKSVTAGVPGFFSVEIGFDVRTIPGFYMPDTHCSETPEHRAWRDAFGKWMERKDKYDKRMKEWREKLAAYLETNGETEFPWAPTELPPPWADELQPPPAPPLGRERARKFTIKWLYTIKITTPIAGAMTPPEVFQEGFTVLIGPCCPGKKASQP